MSDKTKTGYCEDCKCRVDLEYYNGKMDPPIMTCAACGQYVNATEKLDEGVATEVEKDWTADDSGAANSSEVYTTIVDQVKSLIHSSAHQLIQGEAAMVARLIVSHLAHKHHMAPAARPNDTDTMVGHSVMEALQHDQFCLVELNGDGAPELTVVPSSMRSAVNIIKYGG